MDLLHLDMNNISSDEAKLYIKELAVSPAYQDRWNPLHSNSLRAMARLEERAAIERTMPDGTPISQPENVVIDNRAGRAGLLGDSRIVMNPSTAASVDILEKKAAKDKADRAEALENVSTSGFYSGSQGGFTGGRA